MKITFGLILLLCSLSALATVRPYLPGQYELFQANDNGKEFLVRSDFNFADGGTYASGSYVRGDFIASGNLITDVKMFILDNVTGGSSTTVSLGCNSAVDLLAAVNLKDGTYADNYVMQGIPSMAATTNIVRVTAAGCIPKVTITATDATPAAITAGRIVVFTKYIPIEAVR